MLTSYRPGSFDLKNPKLNLSSLYGSVAKGEVQEAIDAAKAEMTQERPKKKRRKKS